MLNVVTAAACSCYNLHAGARRDALLSDKHAPVQLLVTQALGHNIAGGRWAFPCRVNLC